MGPLREARNGWNARIMADLLGNSQIARNGQPERTERCAGCGQPFTPVRPAQRHCRPSCGRRDAETQASLFDNDSSAPSAAAALGEGVMGHTIDILRGRVVRYFTCDYRYRNSKRIWLRFALSHLRQSGGPDGGLDQGRATSRRAGSRGSRRDPLPDSRSRRAGPLASATVQNKLIAVAIRSSASRTSTRPAGARDYERYSHPNGCPDDDTPDDDTRRAS